MTSSTSSMTTSSTLPPNLSLLISNLNSFITVKLDSSNFIIWRSQVLNILRATNLLGFVDGSSPPPPLTIKNVDGAEEINPDYAQWKQIDTHLLSCITATLTPMIFSSVLHLQHSAEVCIPFQLSLHHLLLILLSLLPLLISLFLLVSSLLLLFLLIFLFLLLSLTLTPCSLDPQLLLKPYWPLLLLLLLSILTLNH